MSAKKAESSKVNGEQPKPNVPTVPFSTPEEGVFEVYADYIALNWSAFSVRIRFGQFVGSQETTTAEPKFVIEERAAATLAWPEVKQLHDLLGSVVGRFEKVNGEIKTPKFPI